MNGVPVKVSGCSRSIRWTEGLERYAVVNSRIFSLSQLTTTGYALDFFVFLFLFLFYRVRDTRRYKLAKWQNKYRAKIERSGICIAHVVTYGHPEFYVITALAIFQNLIIRTSRLITTLDEIGGSLKVLNSIHL